MNNTGRQLAIRELIGLIGAAAAEDEKPGDFIRDLQADIEQMPGASVSFSSRNIDDLRARGSLDDVPETGGDALQAALWAASLEYDEGYAAQDEIGALIAEEMGRVPEAPEIGP